MNAVQPIAERGAAIGIIRSVYLLVTASASFAYPGTNYLGGADDLCSSYCRTRSNLGHRRINLCYGVFNSLPMFSAMVPRWGWGWGGLHSAPQSARRPVRTITLITRMAIPTRRVLPTRRHLSIIHRRPISRVAAGTPITDATTLAELTGLAGRRPQRAAHKPAGPSASHSPPANE